MINTFNIRLAQLNQVADTLNKLTIKNADISDFRDSLVKACISIQREDVRGMNGVERHDLFSIIEDTLIPWSYDVIQSENYNYQREMLSVIQQMFTDWIPGWDTNFFVIITEGDYGIIQEGSATYAKLSAYDNVSFAKQRIIITLPKSYPGNFLFNAVLFHEVGHVVERTLRITEDVFSKIFPTPFDQTIFETIVKASFMSIVDSAGKINQAQIKSLLKEYVCDLFCAQYAGEYSIKYLEYKHHQDFDNKSTSHPTVNERIQMIRDFLDFCNTGSTTNILLKYICDQFASKGADKELKIRFNSKDLSCVLEGNTIDCADKNEIYSLFKSGWDLYMQGTDALSAKTGRSITNTELYESIVYNIKDSIARFFKI